MKNKLKESKLLQNASVVSLLAILGYQILYLLIPFQVFTERYHLSLLSPALALMGFGILLLNLLVNRRFLELRSCWLRLLILAVLTISSLVHYRYGLVDNIKCLIWQCVQMLLIAGLISQNFEIHWDRIFKTVFIIAACILAVANLVSFVQYFTIKGYNVNVGGFKIRQGLQEGRLFGIYNNPNESGVISVVILIFSIYYLLRSKNVWLKVVYGFFAAESMVMATLSGSRNIVVAGSVTAFLLCVFLIPHRSVFQKITGKGMKIVLGIVTGLLAAAVTIGAFSLTRDAFSELAVQLHSSDHSDSSIGSTDETSSVSSETEDSSVQEEEDALTENEENPQQDGSDAFEREDTDAQNISNNRFAIWKDYLAILYNEPLLAVLGASPAGYMQYIMQNYPDYYIVSHMVAYYPDMIAHNRIYDTHNAYISAWISGGTVVLLLVIVFLLNIVIRSLRCLYKQETISRELILELSVLAFLLIASFFSTDLFFKCTFSSVAFWVDCGFLIRRLRRNAAGTE